MAQPDVQQGGNRQWLTIHGGWVLLVAGFALIALSAVIGDGVAPIFAVGGIAFILLGVVLPRVVGPLELTRDGFKMFLSEIERETSGMSKEVKGDILDALVENPEPTTRPTSAQKWAREVVASAKRTSELESAIARWLEREGWHLREVPREKRDDRGVDFVAEMDGQVFAIEAKSSLPLPRLDRLLNQLGKVRALLAASKDVGSSPPRVAIFLANRPKDDTVKQIAGDGVEVWIPDGDGFRKVG